MEGQEPQQQQQPIQFDATQLQGYIQQGIQQTMTQLAEQRAAEDAQRAEQERQQAAAREQGQDPMAKVMQPYLQPLALQTQAAVDAATFYTSEPKAAKYRHEIEQIHQSWLQRGIWVSRSEAWENVKGKHQAEFVEETIAEREQAARTAADAQVLGGGLNRPGQMPVTDIRGLPREQQEKLLEGIVF